MAKHANISIFVPHLGCPQNCSFCNQKRISGQKEIPNEKDLEEAVKTAFLHNKDLSNTELAFFGGSFTAIEEEYMLMLLKKGKELVEQYALKGIRISTRPDCISEEILSLLKEYKVTAIELGAQSMNDKVLKLNNRGHGSFDIINASKLIKDNSFELGLQMMTGLYGSDSEMDLETAKSLIELKPVTMRVYPTIVFKDTELCDLFIAGKYKPAKLEETIILCSKIIKLCDENNIKLIRLGLHSSDEVANSVAGPMHPAIMELCQSRIFYNELSGKLGKKGNYKVFVNNRKVSIATGQKKDNINKLKDLGYNVKIIANDNLSFKEFLVEGE